MAYTDYDDFPSIIQGKLKNWNIPLTPVSTRDAQILLYADMAASMIDNALAHRYSADIPFSPVPKIIGFISLWFTIYFIPGSQQKSGENYIKQFLLAQSQLLSLAKGEISLWDEVSGEIIADYDSTLGMETETGESESTRFFPLPEI